MPAIEQHASAGPLISGGDAVVSALVDGGITSVFGIPGGHNLDLFDALARQEAIRTIVPRHEQGAGFMADGYARLSGRTGVCVTLEGPGVGNLLTALGEAYSDHSPVLVVSSQLRRDDLDQGLGMIHEIRGQGDVVGAVTLWSERGSSVEEAGRLVRRALAEHRHGRQRPIHVEVPLDVLAETVALARPTTTETADGAVEPDAATIERAADRIGRGRRPVIYAGGGVNRSGAWAHLRELAERLGAPVVTTALGKGAFPEDHELYVASISLWSPWVSSGPIAELIGSADPLIVLGGRLSDASTNDWSMPLPDSIVQVDIDPANAHPRHQPEVAVGGDVDVVLGAILDALERPSGQGRPDGDVGAMREHVGAHARRNLGWGSDVFEAIGSVLGPATVLMGDSLIGLWAATAWRTSRPRGYHVPLHFNTLGFALPAAVGGRVAEAVDPIVAIAGEGAFMFTMAELGTAVQHELPIIVVVANDGAYTSIKRQQLTRFEGRTLGVDLIAPDLPRLAESMGALGLRAADAKAFAVALEQAAASGRPALIEIPLSVVPPWEA